MCTFLDIYIYIFSGGLVKIKLQFTTLPHSDFVPCVDLTHSSRCNVHTMYTQVSLEPLKPFRTSVEVIVKRKTGGGRWRYEVRVDSTDPPPDDSISLKAPVGGVSSAVFRLCNRYLAYAPFQVSATAVAPVDTPFVCRILGTAFVRQMCCCGGVSAEYAVALVLRRCFCAMALLRRGKRRPLNPVAK